MNRKASSVAAPEPHRVGELPYADPSRWADARGRSTRGEAPLARLGFTCQGLRGTADQAGSPLKWVTEIRALQITAQRCRRATGTGPVD